MAQVSPDDILRLVVKFAHPWTSQIQNVFHLIARGVDTVDDTEILATIQDFLGEIYLPLDDYMGEDTSVLEWVLDRVVFVVDHWETIEHILEQFDITDFTPSGVGDLLPPAVAALVRMRTDVSKHEGRKYFAPFIETNSGSTGRINTNLMNALTATASALLDEYPVTGYDLSLTPVVLDVDQEIHRYPDNSVIPAAWAYQRRRKYNRGL